MRQRLPLVGLPVFRHEEALYQKVEAACARAGTLRFELKTSVFDQRRGIASPIRHLIPVHYTLSLYNDAPSRVESYNILNRLVFSCWHEHCLPVRLSNGETL